MELARSAVSRALLTGAGRYALARGLPGLLNFAALAIFTRLLSEREYGVYALVVASASLVYACGFQWLSLALLRLLHSGSHTRAVFLATALRVFGGVAVATSAVFLLLAPQLGAAVSPGLRWAGLLLLLTSSWHDLNLYLATADHAPGRYALLSALRSIVGFGLGAAAAATGYGVVGVLLGVSLGYAVPGGLALARQWRDALRVPADLSVWHALLRYGLPLAGTYALDYVVSTSDRLLLGVIASTEAAGLYAPAYDLCQQALWALMIIVNLAAYPLAVRAVEAGDPRARDQQFRTHFVLLLAVALPAAVGLALLAPSLSGLLGPRFAPTAQTLLPILALAMLFGGIKSFYFDLSFQLGHATRLQLYTVATAAAVNLLLNIWWIPLLGVHGAAWATLTAYTLALGVSWWLGRRVLKLPVPMGDSCRIALATLGMVLVLLPLRRWTGIPAVGVQVVGGGVTYAGVLLLLNPGGIRTAFFRRRTHV